MRNITTNTRIREFVTDELQIAPGISTVRWQRSRTGRGKVWEPGIMVEGPPNDFHTEGLEIRGTVRKVSYGWRSQMYKVMLWKPSTKTVPRRVFDHTTNDWGTTAVPLPTTYLEAFFGDEAEAADFMRAIAPEFFR